MTQESPAGWLFVRADQVPDIWRDRAQQAAFVALLPEEIGHILNAQPGLPALGPRDQRIAGMFAAGQTTASIAREIGLSTRTVERHLAGLCDRLAVSSTRALALLLAAHGLATSETSTVDVEGAARPPSKPIRRKVPHL